MAAGYAVVGRVRKPHGLHGELVVELHSDAPEVVFATGRRVSAGTRDAEPTGGEYEITRSRPFKDTWLLTLRGVAGRDAADAMRGVCLLQPFDSLAPLEDGEVYVHDLVGMNVVLADGSAVGAVHAVTPVPQGWLLEVETSAGSRSVPFVNPIVVSVDREQRTVVIDPPDGLLDTE